MSNVSTADAAVAVTLDGRSSMSSVAGTPSRGPNPLSTRITGVLSSAYADLEIRDALETLDRRGTRNTADYRRQLRIDVQQEVVQCNGEIVKDFGMVAERLTRIGTAVRRLAAMCDEMRIHVESAHRETRPVLTEAATLIIKRRQGALKEQVLHAFSMHFVITEEDSVVLSSTAEAVDDAFFQALSRVKRIHHDSHLLLGSENERLGLDVLEQSSKQLNAAYQKLYRWTQREFKFLDLENPQIHASVRRSLRVLADRPSLFESCLDSFAEARKNSLSAAFHSALTGTSSESEQPISKPIEFQAHDPLRYIGDMLAWVHSATVSEREALEVLFISEGDVVDRSVQAGRESERWLQDAPDGNNGIFDEKKALHQLVSRDLTGVARLLRQRTEQVIQSHDDATLCYKIANLIGFYKTTFERLLGASSKTLHIFSALEGSAFRQFRANMRDHVAAVESDIAMASTHLSPPPFLEEALRTLTILAESYEASAAAVDSIGDRFETVLEEALDPFLVGCENLSKSLEAPESDIFAVNCLEQARKVLAPYNFADDKTGELVDAVEEHKTHLIDYQHQHLLHASGINPLLKSLSSLPPSADALKSIADSTTLQPDTLVSISQQLDEFLLSPLIDATENLKLLQNRTTIHQVIGEAASRFCEDFDNIEAKLNQLDSLLDDERTAVSQEIRPSLRDLFPRTSGEIRVLLS